MSDEESHRPHFEFTPFGTNVLRHYKAILHYKRNQVRISFQPNLRPRKLTSDVYGFNHPKESS